MAKSALQITSLQNPRIKLAIKLQQRSHRDAAELMLIEGYRELKRAADNGHLPSCVFFCPPLFQGKNELSLIQRFADAGIELLECTEPVFRKMSYRDRPEGLLAVAPQVKRAFGSLVIPDHPLFVVAESIEKPGNLGTILRSADAAGVCALIVCDPCHGCANGVSRSSPPLPTPTWSTRPSISGGRRPLSWGLSSTASATRG